MSPRARLGSIAAAAAAAAALLVSGCGNSAANKPLPVKKLVRSGSDVSLAGFRAKDCQSAGSHGAVSYQLCWRPVGNQHGIFVRVQGKKRAALALKPPGPTPAASMAGRVGHWAWAALSPDGSRFLGQWSAECEVPIAFFASSSGGKPVSVTGESDWTKSPDTMAYGWTTDNRAIVFIPTRPACGTGVFHPGIYLITESCRLQLVWAGKTPPARLERSLKPRSQARLRSILGPSDA